MTPSPPTPSTHSPSSSNSAEECVEKEPQSLISRVFRCITTIFEFILAQWLVIGSGLACLLAYFFPNVAATGGIIHSQFSILYGAVTIIFLVSGLNIPHKHLVSQITQWRIHLITQITSFVIIPAVFLALVHIMAIGGRINTGILTGIVVVSCIPTTISSNVVMTRMAGGEPSAAMIEVVIGNVLGPFITPAMTVGFIPKDPTFSSWRPVENFGLAGLYRHVFMQLGLSVLLPLFVGQMIQWAFPVRTKWVVDKFYLTKISTFCLTLLIWSTFSTCFATDALTIVPPSSIICDVFLNMATYLFFTGLAFMLCRPPKALRAWDPFPLSPPVHLPKGFSWLGDLVSTKSLFRQLSKRETIAVCFCAAAKTTALGIPMVAVLWKGADNTIRSQIQIPVVLYTTEQIFFAQGFVHLFRWWMRRGDDSEPVVQAPDETDAVQLS